MIRRTSLWLVSLLVVSPILGAQQEVQPPSPLVPEKRQASQLVAWSEMQKPRPAPVPISPIEQQQLHRTDTPQNPDTSPNQQQGPTQAFTGTIVKNETNYVLRVSESVSYPIDADDQGKAGLYESKQVKVAGSYDARGNVLHIASIELLS